jgi:methyl-accepting chemotaxis protein PixJ
MCSVLRNSHMWARCHGAARRRARSRTVPDGAKSQVQRCLFACITGRAMALRARAHASGERGARLIWMACGGMVIGTGMWAAHFASMLAYDVGLPMAFDIGLAALSLLFAAFATAAGFVLGYTRWNGALGGMMGGAGVVAMHYTGMAAVRLPAMAVWNPQIVIASVLIGIALTGISGHFALLKPTRLNGIAAVALRVGAIPGVHFSSMAAVRFVPINPAASTQPLALSLQTIGVLVIAAGLFILGQALVLLDRHLSRRTHGYVRTSPSLRPPRPSWKIPRPSFPPPWMRPKPRAAQSQPSSPP